MSADNFDQDLHAYLARRAARDSACSDRVVGATAAMFTAPARNHRLTPVLAAVGIPLVLAATLASALFIHARHTSARLGAPVPVPSAAVVPSFLPSATPPTTAPPVSTAAASPAGAAQVGGPSPWRLSPAMATGPGLPTILYGGALLASNNSCGSQFDTYAWDGRHWYRVIAAAGPRLVVPTLGWDPLTRRILLVGHPAAPWPGCYGLPSQSVQTWAWVPDAIGVTGKWSRLTTRHAPQLVFSWGALAFDGTHRRLVFHAFERGVDNWSAETWTWDGADWSRAWAGSCGVPHIAPCPSAPALVAQGPAGGVMGLDAGTSAGTGTVFGWTGAGWTAAAIPGAPYIPVAIAYDGLTGRTLAIGRTALTMTSESYALYAYDGTHWTSMAMPLSLQHRTSMTFSGGARGGGSDAILWGGEADSATTIVPVSETWTYSSGSTGWRKVAD